jgi:hypothetical protein
MTSVGAVLRRLGPPFTCTTPRHAVALSGVENVFVSRGGRLSSNAVRRLRDCLACCDLAATGDSRLPSVENAFSFLGGRLSQTPRVGFVNVLVACCSAATGDSRPPSVKIHSIRPKGTSLSMMVGRAFKTRCGSILLGNLSSLNVLDV